MTAEYAHAIEQLERIRRKVIRHRLSPKSARTAARGWRARVEVAGASSGCGFFLLETVFCCVARGYEALASAALSWCTPAAPAGWN